MRRLYLSPSNQPANRYAVGNTTEKIEMEVVAKAVQFYLQDYEVETVMASLYLNFAYRDEEARLKGCTDYLAIHSNAGGGGTAIGTVAFYHRNQPSTKILAEKLVSRLDGICPYKENRANQVVDGMAQYDGYGLGEVREPAKKGINANLLEVNFHDNPLTAKWIIDNKDAIAKEIAMAYVETYSIAKKRVDKVQFATVVAKPYLNVRADAGTQFPKIAYLEDTSEVWIMGEKDGWYKVAWGPNQGWVSAKYLKLI